MKIDILHLAAHFREIGGRLQKFMEKDAPKYAGNVAVSKFKENYDSQGFYGRRWKLPRRLSPGIGGSYTDSRGRRRKVYAAKHDNLAGTRKVLHGRTGNLKRSISSEVSGAGVATIYSDSPYGARHNEGLDGMPKRQFIGGNQIVTNAIKTEIERRVNQIFSAK